MIMVEKIGFHLNQLMGGVFSAENVIKKRENTGAVIDDNNSGTHIFYIPIHYIPSFTV
jgi:hypothetical protein